MNTPLTLDKIRLDGGTQPRAQLNFLEIGEYTEAMKAGAQFPPVVVFYDGVDHWLADGFHRYHAARQAGLVEIDADIRQGTQRDAVLFSVGVNSAHGMRRTNDDKRRSVTTLLADPEWGKWSDREIARQCNVSHTFVQNLRPFVTGNVASEKIYMTRQGTVATMNTANIGARIADETIEKGWAEFRQLVFEYLNRVFDDENEDIRLRLNAGGALRRFYFDGELNIDLISKVMGGEEAMKALLDSCLGGAA